MSLFQSTKPPLSLELGTLIYIYINSGVFRKDFNAVRSGSATGVTGTAPRWGRGVHPVLPEPREQTTPHPSPPPQPAKPMGPVLARGRGQAHRGGGNPSTHPTPPTHRQLRRRPAPPRSALPPGRASWRGLRHCPPAARTSSRAPALHVPGRRRRRRCSRRRGRSRRVLPVRPWLRPPGSLLRCGRIDLQ